jgi:hypothetical protein
MTAESDLAPVLHIERELRHLSVEITQPKTGECLHCYVYRMLEFGCTGLRWAQRYRDLRAPRATAFRRRLMSKGAGCDCEIFMNGWSLRRTYQLWDPETEEYEYPGRVAGLHRCASWLDPALSSLDRPLPLVSERPLKGDAETLRPR